MVDAAGGPALCAGYGASRDGAMVAELYAALVLWAGVAGHRVGGMALAEIFNESVTGAGQGFAGAGHLPA